MNIKMRQLTATFLIMFFCTKLFAQVPTFVKDVAPIIHSKCSPCHRPNEAAPFSLISYEDVAKRTGFIKKVISSGYMPPWRADNHYAEYSNNRSLTDKEKETIISWIENSAPKGTGEVKNIAQLTSVRSKTAYHRAADTSLLMPQPFQLPGDNAERFIIVSHPL
jgi:hypothetical protein